jgi:hypothetical protein
MAFYISGPKLLFETTEISTHPNSTQQESNYIYLYTTKLTDCHDITEILLKVALNTIILTPSLHFCLFILVFYSIIKNTKDIYMYDVQLTKNVNEQNK